MPKVAAPSRGAAAGAAAAAREPSSRSAGPERMDVDAQGGAGAAGADLQGVEPMPLFPPVSAADLLGGKVEWRKVTVPLNRLTPLKGCWMDLYNPVTQNMRVDMRMNLKTRKVELKTTKETSDPSALQKCADFVHAFVLGFEVQDALALLRLDDLYIECFEVKDVKQTLHGEHMSRGIGRMAGKGGKTKFTIENATKTRIVIADTHIRILGSFQNIKIARDSICALIMGSPPGKVFTRLRNVTAHLADK